MFNLDDELELLRQKHSQPGYVAPQLQETVQAPYSNENDLGTILGAAGIGFGNMVNNTIFGGAGQILGTLGRGVELISPWSGSQDDKVSHLMDLGVSYEDARQAYPYIDSVITSIAKGSLATQNAFSDAFSEARNNLLGDNPSLAAQIAEGTGSSLGFLATGLLGKAKAGSNLVGALVSGLTEALSESGGTLGEAYKAGLYDNGALTTANKSFAANALLNAALDTTIGRFAPHTEKIRNPYTRFGVQTLEEVLNEIIQEPSQQVIERAANRELFNGEDFLPALGRATFGDENGNNWWTLAKQLAPSVAGSTLVTQGLLGLAGLAHPQIRQNISQEYRNRNVDIDATESQLRAEYDRRARLQQRLEREQSEQNDTRVIQSLNKRISNSDKNIARLSDMLLPNEFEYTPDIPQEFQGRQATVLPSNKNKNGINIRYKLVEADSLITSNNDDFSINENYPQELQPRIRNSEANKKDVTQMAGTLTPDLLTDSHLAALGAPIVGNDNVVESGNGRTMAIRQAYSAHTDVAEKYRQYLIDHAQDFDIDPQLAARMKKPVLVRERLSNVDRVQFTSEANEQPITPMSDTENAITDSQSLNSELLSLYDVNKSTADNQNFLKAFYSSFSPDVQNQLSDLHGNYSQSFIKRAQNALIALAYGNNSDLISKLVESTEPVSKNISNALIALAPRFAKLNAGGRQYLSISQDIADAVLRLDSYRRNAREGLSVNEQVQQRALSDNQGNVLEGQKISTEAQTLLQFFHEYGNKPNDILRALANYADLAAAQAEQGQATLDPDLNLDKLSILRKAIDSVTQQQDNNTPLSNAQDRNYHETIPAGLQNPDVQRLDSFEIEKPDAQRVDIPKSEKATVERVPIPQIDRVPVHKVNLNNLTPNTEKGTKGLNEDDALTTTRILMGDNFSERINPQESLKADTRSYSTQVDNAQAQRINIPQGEKVHAENIQLPQLDRVAAEDLSLWADNDKQQLYETLTGQTLTPDTEHITPQFRSPKATRPKIRKSFLVPTSRLDFSRQAEQKTNRTSHNYNGYVGDFSFNRNGESSNAQILLDNSDGKPIARIYDQNGNNIAVYDLQSRQFHSLDGDNSNTNIQEAFLQSVGKRNPVEGILRKSFMQKAIAAGEHQDTAQALADIYIESNKAIADSAHISLLDTVTSDNLSILRDNSNTRNRGNSTFEQRTIADDGTVREARNIIQLFQKSDRSTILHELAHNFIEKIKNLEAAERLSGQKMLRGKLRTDWGNIKREFGIADIDFSNPLSQNDSSRYINFQEQVASAWEKYFMKGQAPEGAKSSIKRAFEAFKGWLKAIYTKLRGITWTDAKGIARQASVPETVKSFFDHLLLGGKPSTESNLDANAAYENARNRSAISPLFQSDIRKGLLQRVSDAVKNGFGSLFSVAHKPQPQRSQAFSFLDPDTARRFREAETVSTRKGSIARISELAHNIVNSMKGDFPELSQAPNAKERGLLGAQEAFRQLQRRQKKSITDTLDSMKDNLRSLDAEQRHNLNAYMMLADLNWQIQDSPDALLPFGLTPDMVRREFARVQGLADNDPLLHYTIQQEDIARKKLTDSYITHAAALGINVSDILDNPHYFRHRVIDYLSTAGTRMPGAVGNQDVEGIAAGMVNRGWLKRRKGSLRDIVADYYEANAEVRAQMAQDVETMKTLLLLKKEHDYLPKAIELWRKRNGFNSQNQQGTFSFNQAIEDNPEALSDFIPDSHELVDTSALRLIETSKSNNENLVLMALGDVAEQRGLPIDKMYEIMGVEVDPENKNLMVLPKEIAKVLRRISKDRHRGMLAQAAKDLTTWWKKSVLFSPFRNLKYNFRNFTGDFDALIAGNPRALQFVPRALKDLTALYTHRGKSNNDFKPDPDLQDYIDRSGGLSVQSLHLSPSQAQQILDAFPTKKPGKKAKQKTIDKYNAKEQARIERIKARLEERQAQQLEAENPSNVKKLWDLSSGLVKKFFNNEVAFTEWREHILRYAAYLDYKQQMEQNGGKPLNWGASIEDEVMSVKDIKDRAYKMSNELLGAYDQVSEVGKQLRDMLIPFYSWMEVNMRRYYRLFKNGIQGKNQSNWVRKLLLGKAVGIPAHALTAADAFGKIALFTLATQLFNRTVMAEPDDDLPDDVKYRPHITLGRKGNDTYYFDRIGALADVADWFSLDSIALDVKDIANGQQTFAGYLKKILQAPISKAVNGLNPGIKMPIELAMGRSMFPDVFNPSTIKDPAEYVARSFALQWPYKAVRGIPRDNWQELSNILLYTSNADEAAYWQTLDKVRQFQSTVLDKHFDGFASTQRGRILQKLKLALRYNDGDAVRRYIREFYQADGTKQGLKASMRAMNPLFGLSEKEKAQFLKWLTPNDRKFLRKAERYYHQLADRFIQ